MKNFLITALLCFCVQQILFLKQSEALVISFRVGSAARVPMVSVAGGESVEDKFGYLGIGTVKAYQPLCIRMPEIAIDLMLILEDQQINNQSAPLTFQEIIDWQKSRGSFYSLDDEKIILTDLKRLDEMLARSNSTIVISLKNKSQNQILRSTQDALQIHTVTASFLLSLNGLQKLQ